MEFSHVAFTLKRIIFFFFHFLMHANKEANEHYLPVSQEKSKKSEIP